MWRKQPKSTTSESLESSPYEVVLYTKPLSLAGTAAVTWLRTRGLRQANLIHIGEGWRVQIAKVDPAFARVWFPSNTGRVEISVDLNDFDHGEFVDEPEYEYKNYSEPKFLLTLSQAQIQNLVIKDHVRREVAAALPAPKCDSQGE